MSVIQMPHLTLGNLLRSRLGRNLFSRRNLIIGLAVVAVLWGGGDGRPRVLGAATKPRAWFDAKGAFVFPLGKGPLPTTRDELSDSLTRGFRAGLKFPESDNIVEVLGGRYPAIGSVHIHLSGGTTKIERENDKDPALRPTGKIEGKLTVRDFDLDARPIINEKSKLDIHVSATDARLDMEHDEKGRPMIMLADARDASFQFEASTADIERALVRDLSAAGGRYGLSVHKAKLVLTAKNNRAVDVDLHLSTKIAFIPAGLHFQAHVDIDNNMNARLSRLKCDGDEALGPLLINLIRPGLKKYEGKSKPVFSFPTGQLKLTDVKIEGGDQIKVSATFTR